MTYEEWLNSEMTVIYAGKVIAKGKIKDLCKDADEENENEGDEK